MNRRWGWVPFLLFCATLVACSGGPVRRVSPPAASIQQLTVNADGSWSVDLRLQNYSSIPMRFTSASLAITVGDQTAGTLHGAPQISIGPESADVVALPFKPSAEARMAIADALAGRRPLGYTLKGKLDAVPEEAGKSRSFDIDTRNTLNPVPGLDGVLR
ncbi:MAG TPA: LEA type 2 family protein [Pseudoxanthomonas sp.]